MLLLHVQKENSYSISPGTKITNWSYATNGTLKEAIAGLKKYEDLISARTTSPRSTTTLLSVCEIEELSVDEMKFMGIILIEGLLESLTNHPLLQK